MKNFVRDGYGEGTQGTITGREVLDCALGVNPFGPSPLALNASQREWQLNRYPEPRAPMLAASVADRWGIEADSVLPTAGADAALELINKAFLRSGMRVVGLAPQYPEYITEVRVLGARYEHVSAGDPPDVSRAGSSLASQRIPRGCLVFVDNPNNPTGQVLSPSLIAGIAQNAWRTQSLVIVDEAYGDFLNDELSAINLQEQFPNVIVVRSLSKGVGLAALRIGFLVAKRPYLDTLRAYSLPYPVSGPAEVLGSIGVRDLAHLRRSRDQIRKAKALVLDAFRSFSNLFCVPSHPEVPIMLVGTRARCVDLAGHLLQHGIAAVPGRYFVGLGPRWVRLRICDDTGTLIERLLRADTALSEDPPQSIPVPVLGER